jgi:hypothetical protein
MGLMDALRRAEEQGRDTARRGLERAKDTWEDAERRLRRRMRVFPGSMKSGRSTGDTLARSGSATSEAMPAADTQTATMNQPGTRKIA